MRAVKKSLYENYEDSFKTIERQIEGLEYFKVILDDYLHNELPNTYYESIVDPIGTEVCIIIFLGEDKIQNLLEGQKQKIKEKIDEMYRQYSNIPYRIKYVNVKRLHDHPKALFLKLKQKNPKAIFSYLLRLKEELEHNLKNEVKGYRIRVKGKKKDRKELKKIEVGSPSRHITSPKLNLKKRTYNVESKLGSMGIKIEICRRKHIPKNTKDILTCAFKNVSDFISYKDIEELRNEF